MNLSRGVLDRSMVAKRLREVCVIPAIWYCVEAVTLKKSSIESKETARFKRQIPVSSSMVLTWMDSGL